MNGVFVTGTDTDIGKTEIALALMAALQQRGLTVMGMKPVATGCAAGQRGLVCGDALRLQSQSSHQADYPLINPYAFVPAIAPHLAAREAGVEISLERIRASFGTLAADADLVVVEGVGGWRVPLAQELAVSDLPTALGLPVVLVVGIRLGCLSHALLTVEAIRARGARLAGWVANIVAPRMHNRDENIQTLEEMIDAPNLGVVPWQTEVHTEVIARQLDVGPLLPEG
jgi:dethiobiotin synthetase